MGDRWKDAASAAMERHACREDGGEEDFEQVYELLAPRLSAFLLRRTRDAAKTDDLVQATFAKMHEARRHFTPGASVVAWAYAIARRLQIDAHRKSGREIGGHDHEEDEDVGPRSRPDALFEQGRLARRVDLELAQVPEDQREAFVLVHLEGLTPGEAAQALGTTALAIRMRIHRACKILRAALGDQARELLGERT